MLAGVRAGRGGHTSGLVEQGSQRLGSGDRRHPGRGRRRRPRWGGSRRGGLRNSQQRAQST
eukprot:scaffold82795_cov48-Phaeocystis_antarctica.AAC.3